MLEIVLREYLGYTVNIVKSLSPTSEIEQLAMDEIDANIEMWDAGADTPPYRKYVVQDNIVEILGPIGYIGREGLFVNERLAKQEPLSTSYQFWKDSSRFPKGDIVRFGDLDIEAWMGDAFPGCRVSQHPWCGQGQFESYWAPPQCTEEPQRCAALLHAVPSYSDGLFEQWVSNHNLSTVVTYAGTASIKLAKEVVDQGRNALFYWWEPDPLVNLVRGRRVSFPDFEFGCMFGDTQDPFGAVTCDTKENMLAKGVRRDLRTQAPEAYYALSRMQLLKEDIGRLMDLHVEGGGPHNSSFDAACAFVKAHAGTVIATMAPPCISAPPANPVTGDFLFDRSLMTCTPITAFPETTSVSSCVPRESTTPDRTDVKIKIAKRNATSHELASNVLQILLVDLLRYSVILVDASAFPASLWGTHMAKGAYHVDIENWFASSSSSSYQEYVTARGMAATAPVGYSGRSALFVLPHTVAKSPFVDYWRFYADGGRGEGAVTDFYRFADVDLRAMLGSAFPVCSPSAYPWCGSGATEGFYVPPACENNTADCAVVFAATPDTDTGYFEQITKNLELPLVHAFLGTTKLAEFVHSVHAAATRDILFYGFEPDTLPASVQARRVSFPDHYFGCTAGDTRSPLTGTVECDAKPVSLDKVWLTELAKEAPEAAFIIKHFTILTQDMRDLLHRHTAGGAMDAHGTACAWVKDNLATLRETVVPDCVARPKALVDLSAGDRVFIPEEGVCVQLSCPASQVLAVVFESFVCQSCETGLLPDPNQTRCIPCPPGSSPVQNNVSGVLECACDHGTREVLDSGGLQCLTCAAGTYAGTARSTSCLDCPVGSYSSAGSQACTACPKGSASTTQRAGFCPRCAKGRFQEHEGASACTACPENMCTSILGAESKEACHCLEGFFRDGPGGTCMNCPEGMICPAGSDMALFSQWHEDGLDIQNPLPPFPRLRVGFMSLASDPLSVYQCSGPHRCPGGAPGTCGPDLLPEVASCGECRDDYRWDGERCVKCRLGSSAWLLPALPVLVLPLVVLGLYLTSRDEVDRWGHWRNCMSSLGLLLVNSFQTVAAVLRANLAYNDFLSSWITVVSYSEDPTYLFQLQCAGITNFRENVLMRTLIPVLLALVVIFTYLASQVLTRLANDGNRAIRPMNLDRCANVYFSLIFAFFSGLSSMAMTTFMCAGNPNGKNTLIVDRSIHCYEREWNGVVAISAVAILYVFGFGVLFCRATYIAPKAFSEKAFRRRWKFLFAKFSPDVWWWALCFCAKGVLVNVGFTFIKDGHLQLYWVMLVIVLYTFALTMLSPWRHSPAVTMDLSTCFILIVIISMVTFVHASPAAIYHVGDVLNTCIAGLILLPILAAGCLLLWAIRAQVPSVKAARKDEILEHYHVLTNLTASHLEEEEVVRILDTVDDRGRWHIIQTLRLVSSEVAGLHAHRISDGRLCTIVTGKQQGVHSEKSTASWRSQAEASESSDVGPRWPPPDRIPTKASPQSQAGASESSDGVACRLSADQKILARAYL